MDRKLLLERLERLAIVLDELMPQCAELVRDALAMLKKQEEEIENLRQTCQSMMEGVCLLKEQETGHWVFLENCSNSGIYCSECHTKVFNNYPFKKKFSYFCPHCGTRMEGEIERR